MVCYRIGIIDDDESKVIEIVDKLAHAFESVPEYQNYGLVPIEIEATNDMEETLETIISKNIECMIIDYNLSSSSGFNGVELANALWSYRKHLPVFMLTSFDEAMYTHELFSAYQIFNYDRYLREPLEQNDIHKKIVREIEIYHKKIASWEAELLKLLERKGESAEIDSRIMELDSELESTINGQGSIPQKIKSDFSESVLQKLINDIERILEGD